MTTNAALVAESGVMENHISDHYLIFTVLKLKLPKPQPTFITVRSYKHYDRNVFGRHSARAMPMGAYLIV